MPIVFRTASFRLASLYFIVFAVSGLVMGGAVFIVARSALEEQMISRITTETAFLREELRSGGIERLVAVVRLREKGAKALDYLVQDDQGEKVAGEMPEGGKSMRPGWATVDLLDGGILIAVGDDLGQLGELEESIASAFAWTVGLAGLLGIGGGFLISRAFLARVEGIARTAEAIISGDLTQRVPIRGTDDDLDRLATTLNRMLDRIDNLMESLRQISTDVAHDLRTPLSRLYQRLEYARAHARTVPEYTTAVEAAMTEAEALLGTFSALLRIAQVEGASPRDAFRRVDLSAVVEAVTDAYGLDAEEAGHHLVADIAPHVFINGDEELLTQALANLVENALRHTPGGTRLDVRLVADPAALRLVVEDNGPGVSPQDLQRLTRRFYRAERSRTAPGNGLGLSLVSAVAELHGATLTLEAGTWGFRATITFTL
jgi:signal transduction histidine kinase